MATPPKGMILDIARSATYRSGQPTSLAEKFDSVTLVGTYTEFGRKVQELPREARVFGEKSERPAVLLGINGRSAPHLKPAVFNEATGQYELAPGTWASGGHYAATSDSRVSAIVEEFIGHPFYGALTVHDFDMFPGRS